MSNWLYTYDGETERVQIGGTEIVDGDAEHAIGRLRTHTLDGNVVAIEIRDQVDDEELEEDDREEEAVPVPASVVSTPRVPAAKKGGPRKRAEDAPQPASTKRVYTCSQCGQPGHTARKCEGSYGRPAAPEPFELTEDEIEEIKQRRADGETTTEIAAVMELNAEQVAKVMADRRPGKGDGRDKKSTFDSFDDAVKRLVAQGCSAGDIKIAYPNRSDREIEEAVAYAQHAI